MAEAGEISTIIIGNRAKGIGSSSAC